MPWLKIDDRFTDHEKVDRLSDAAFRLHMRGLCHCAHDNTDGAITAKAVRVLLVKQELSPKKGSAAVQELIHGELWHPAGDGGYLVNDYLKYNPSAEQVRERQDELSRLRSEAGRKGAASRWANGKDGKTDGNGDGNAYGNTRMAPSRPVEVKTLADDIERMRRKAEAKAQ